MSATTAGGALTSTPKTLFKNRYIDGGQIVGLEDTDSGLTVGNYETTNGNADFTWPDDKTVVRQSAALTTARSGTLPNSSAFAPGTIISFIDRITTSSSGKMNWTVQGSDTLHYPAAAGGGGYTTSDPDALALFAGNGVQRYEVFTGGWIMMAEPHAGYAADGTVLDGVLAATGGVVSAAIIGTGLTISSTTISADIGTSGAKLPLLNAANTWSGHQTILDVNIPLGTTTGTKFGTATGQKLSFWNQTPIIQPSGTGETSGFTAGAGTAVLSDSTFTGNSGTKAYTVGDLVKHLKAVGILAAS